VTNYYVYYRVAPERMAALRPEIQELFEKMHEHSGVRGRWMRRRDDPSTCMEVYEGVQDEAAFEAVLARESAHLGLERKTERFVCA
jgi:quinol monooxygenase YgiN